MNINIKEEKIDLGFPNPEINNTPSVFVGKILLTDDDIKKLGSQIRRELYIFGALVKRRAEFMVIEKNLATNEIIKHHLAQFNYSVMYKRESDKTAGERVDMLKKNDILYLQQRPKWKASEASIPRYEDRLFYFVKQFFIPENATNKQYGTWDETVFVFLYVTEQDELLVQIFCQNTSAQTAEDHYKLELMIAEYEKNYKNVEVVSGLLKKGDKFFHEYVCEHPKTSKETLEILLEYAKTQVLKTQIKKLLK